MNTFTSQGYEVFIVGRYFCDLVFKGLPELPRLGHEVYSEEFKLIPGGVCNAAFALHRLGVKTAWPCEFGNDVFSQYVKMEAIKECVDGSFFKDLDYDALHLTAAFSFEGERGFLSYTDPLSKYAYSDLIKETRPKWVYITHLVLGDELDGLVKAARAVDAKIIMDCQAHDFSLSAPIIQDALRKVDIFSPNRNEAKTLTGENDIDEMLSAINEYVKIVIIKDGANGCYYRDREKEIHIPAFEVEVVDTTGAGDNFDSGFLYGQVRGYSIEDSLRIGNFCGGISATGFGGTSTSPSEDSLLKYLNR